MDDLPPAEAEIHKGKIIIWDEAQSNKIYQSGHYGKPLSGGKLQLGPVEALYLVDRGKLTVLDERGKKLKFKEIFTKFSELDPELPLKYPAYADLRSRGYVVKTGLKFGAHFRVYERGEVPGQAHSKLLVHAVPEFTKITPTELARAVRLAHSVKKKIMLAIVDDEGDITYYS
ncbi:MAG: tRNA-intron lyase, partial [Candidatus Hadarchaeales archaeon]